MITTAGKGPGPSGLKTVAGICSKAPWGAVVGMDKPEVVLLQLPRNMQVSTSSMSLVSILLPSRPSRRLGVRGFQSLQEPLHHGCGRGRHDGVAHGGHTRHGQGHQIVRHPAWEAYLLSKASLKHALYAVTIGEKELPDAVLSHTACVAHGRLGCLW